MQSHSLSVILCFYLVVDPMGANALSRRFIGGTVFSRIHWPSCPWDFPWVWEGIFTIRVWMSGNYERVAFMMSSRRFSLIFSNISGEAWSTGLYWS